MAIRFGDKRTADLCRCGSCKGVPDAVARRSGKLFDLLGAAVRLDDVRFMRSARLTKVKGHEPTRFRVHISDNWWIGFAWAEPDCVDVRLEHVAA